MGEGKHIYNHFKFWSVADCSCEYCLNYPGKNRLCPLEVCCVADIREEAFQREQAAVNGSQARKGVMPCRE